MSDAETIDTLAAQVRTHRQKYYQGEPDISDAEFDALEDRLRALAPDHPVLGEVGAAVESDDGDTDADAQAEALRLVEKDAPDRLAAQLVAAAEAAYAGATPDAKFYKGLYLALQKAAPEHPALLTVPPARGLDWPKAAHEIPMGSLNKVNTADELAAWATRCDELAAAGELPPISDDLALTEKLDGISIEVVYDHGTIEAAITRGDGLLGERVTPNVMRMKGVPAKIGYPGRVSVRGEIILRKSDAPALETLKQKTDRNFERIKSLRNTAAGVARTKEARLLPGCKLLTILFYDVEGVDGFHREQDKLAFLETHGFERPHLAFGDLAAIQAEHDRYQDSAREALDYDIDGLVIRAANVDTATLLGELNHRPRAAVAYKFGNEMQVSTLRAILWSTGDSGRITPIAQIDPVFLAGAEVRQASLHNLANVKALEIGVGDQVLVSRRNDVIPYVEKVVVDGGNREEAPERCAVCNTPVEVDGEYLICVNLDCPARRLGRLKTWVKHLGLLEWGEKTFVKFMDAGLVNEPADLYRLTMDDVTRLEGYGEVSATRLLEPLAAKKQLPIDIFIAALGVPAVSRETAKLLVGAGYDTFEKITAATEEQLADIEGLGSIKAAKILTGLGGRMPEIQRLAEVGVVPVMPEEGGPLAGLSFTFSGAQNRPRKELQAIVENNGGTVRSAVTKGLTYLVLADPESTSSKAQKARKLGTQIIDGNRFEEIVKERGGRI